MIESGKDGKSNGIAGEGMQGQHRWFLAVSAFFFFYLVVEGALLIPFIVIRYGWH